MYLNQRNSQFSLNIKGELITLDRPYLMGILNLTPDSFYDGGRRDRIETIAEHIQAMIDEGADMIDIGAMSSRPYSNEISLEEELDRIKYLPEIVQLFPHQIFSIDTYRSEVADYAIRHGVAIINDITAGRKDERILSLAKESQTPFIAMHMQGMPRDMQSEPRYDHICAEILYFFSERLDRFYKLGMNDIILDLGFGFGKSIEDNYKLLKNLAYFSELNCPMLVGISRKSMIYKPLEITPAEALNGTTALHFEALRQGAHILRVHDIKEAKQVVDLWEIYKSV